MSSAEKFSGPRAEPPILTKTEIFVEGRAIKNWLLRIVCEERLSAKQSLTSGALQKGKKILLFTPKDKPVLSVEKNYLEQASEWADKLIKNETRRPGDYDNAMQRIARETGVPYRTLWALRYRKPKDVTASVYFALLEAYETFRLNRLERMKIDAEKTGSITEP